MESAGSRAPSQESVGLKCNVDHWAQNNRRYLSTIDYNRLVVPMQLPARTQLDGEQIFWVLSHFRLEPSSAQKTDEPKFFGVEYRNCVD